MKNATELEFEDEFIDYLSNIGGVKQWEYAKEIKTIDQLWLNFKRILEKNNQARLKKELSVTEFNFVKEAIMKIRTPYEAGQFLHGINGVSEVDITLDDGQTVFLTVFDQSQVGAGNTVYQVVNQIGRTHVIDGKLNRRFDVTLLINGLPIIQIELKKARIAAGESFNQMKQYVAEKQFTNIFSTLQILVAMTPYEIKYMANTSIDSFNTDFAFNWQDEKTAQPIRNWKQFSDLVLSIPMAHNLATRYMILDGTKNREHLKVMRPYQVYATRSVIEKVEQHKFKYSDGKLGYIWHTTGSGKTITSFKTAWLASRLPNVDKVIFLVDRIALTNQTSDAYRAYDPVAGFSGNSGIVSDTDSVNDLFRKLKSKSNKNILVTSIQKMSILSERKSLKELNQNILFIVDEAHRSTGDGTDSDGMLERIRTSLPTAAWVGYTGTPKFPQTKEIFGELLHAYTIKEAIADKNVLGFKVEFKETIDAPLDPSADDIDDNIRQSVYDTSPDHVRLVVKDIVEKWDSRSNNRKYNALFSVHVGGVKTSSPRVMEYYDEFSRVNQQLDEDKKLKVGVSFSMVTNNSNYQLETNENLHRAIKDYNKMFNVNYDMTTIKEYSEDFASRLNKTAMDGKYLDLAIVIDQYLTGFDAQLLNTLYLDRTLKGSALIQAYSRTNRIHNFTTKPWGIIVNYRWPAQNEILMNEALAVYSDRSSGDEQQSFFENKEKNIDDGILAADYHVIQEDLKSLLSEISDMTDGFIRVPASEKQQEDLFVSLSQYNGLMNKIKQYPFDEKEGIGYPADNPEQFFQSLGITEDQEIILTTVIANELKQIIAKKEDIDISHINLAMEHIQEIIINYDYLIDLIAKMADQVHEKKMDEASNTKVEVIKELNKIDNDRELLQIQRFVEQIFDGSYVFDKYPAPRDTNEMKRAMDQAAKKNSKRLIGELIAHFGLFNSVSVDELYSVIKRHRRGQDDLDKQNHITNIINKSKPHYKDLAVQEVAELSWINYRRELKERVFELAEEIKETEE